MPLCEKVCREAVREAAAGVDAVLRNVRHEERREGAAQRVARGLTLPRRPSEGGGARGQLRGGGKPAALGGENAPSPAPSGVGAFERGWFGRGGASMGGSL